MAYVFLSASLIYFVFICHSTGYIFTQPEQVHLAYGVSPDEMVVTWVTQNSTGVSVVEYGYTNLNLAAKGVEEVFVDGGSEQRKFYNHRVVLKNLTPGDKYTYHCGSPLGWSSLFTFTAMRSGNAWSPRFALIGDMGNVNSKSLGFMQEETQKGLFDAILHVGDFAYNMDTDNARVGDDYMNQIQAIAAYVPYMTSAGNHENAYNFSNYRSRFSMPTAGGDGENLYYSFNVGPAHIISFNSEMYYYNVEVPEYKSMSYNKANVAQQYKWLEKDLIEANKPENRQKHPWIISMCHRPLYCSNSDDPEHCPNMNNMIRVGMNITHEYPIEKLLYEYGVDMHFQAHEHSYERMFPVYKSKVCNGSSTKPYVNPKAPVHIVTGSGGCQENTDPFYKIPFPYSAFQSDDYGYTRMHIYNSTHLFMDQVSVDVPGGKVIDEMLLVKDYHGAGLYDCHLQ